MKLIVSIYRSSANDEMYLYVDKQKGVSAAPEGLMKPFGKPIHIMDMLLTPERKLSREVCAKVMDNIQSQGYHLQMPPADNSYRQILPEK
ncbi:MAG: YcgL domain-containing protein [Endozoicomonadaceae bacterium]|nr:YcgL domain-containing protein [Endozoicomonadaceae bacterium]